MNVEKFAFRSGLVFSFATLILLIWFIPSYLQRINEISSYLSRQNAEFEKLEHEAWKLLREAKRTKRQWKITQFEPEDSLYTHLPTPIIPRIPLRRPSKCQCDNNNNCPGKKLKREIRFFL